MSTNRATLELFAALDRSRPEPLRAQLEDAICAAITGGGLPPGTRLPASRSLAESLHVSRGVVSEAYAQIAAEGWIEVRHGAAPVVRAVPAREHKEGQSLFEVRSLPPPPRLDLTGDGAGPLRVPAAGVGGGAAQGAGGDAGRGARLRRSARGRRAPPRARGVPGARPGRGGERGRPGDHVAATRKGCGWRAGRSRAEGPRASPSRTRRSTTPGRRSGPPGSRSSACPSTSTGSIRRAWTRTRCSSRPRTSSRPARCSRPSAGARCWPGAGSCSRTTTTPSTATTAPRRHAAAARAGPGRLPRHRVQDARARAAAGLAARAQGPHRGDRAGALGGGLRRSGDQCPRLRAADRHAARSTGTCDEPAASTASAATGWSRRSPAAPAVPGRRCRRRPAPAAAAAAGRGRGRGGGRLAARRIRVNG